MRVVKVKKLIVPVYKCKGKDCIVSGISRVG